jgi:hypothetical protein
MMSYYPKCSEKFDDGSGGHYAGEPCKRDGTFIVTVQGVKKPMCSYHKRKAETSRFPDKVPSKVERAVG